MSHIRCRYRSRTSDSHEAELDFATSSSDHSNRSASSLPNVARTVFTSSALEGITSGFFGTPTSTWKWFDITQ